MKRHPAEIVLHALLAGQHVTLASCSYAMAEDGDLVFVGDDKSKGYAVGFTFQQFIKDCERLSEEDVRVIGMVTALTEIRRGDGR